MCLSFIVLAITAGAGSPAGAQGTSGTIAGTVLDPSGAAVPGATVTVTSGTTEAGTAVTDAAGSYTVHNLAAGAYRVEVQLQGFERFVRADVQVQVGATTRVDAALEVGGAMLEEVVVTARRREERLQDTPVAISPFTAATLEARQIQQTQDLERITPSLQFKPAGQLSGNTAASVVFIRGVGQLDPTAAVDPGVGIYIDEVYVGRAVGGLIDFGDIAGVEVLRGPQGTLFGRNTIGGAILVRTRTPEIGKFSSKVRLRVGQDGLYDGFAAVNLPLGDTAAARLSGGFRKRDGYVTRAVRRPRPRQRRQLQLERRPQLGAVREVPALPPRRLHQARRERRAVRLRRHQRNRTGSGHRQRRRRLPRRDHAVPAPRRPAPGAAQRAADRRPPLRQRLPGAGRLHQWRHGTRREHVRGVGGRRYRDPRT